MWLDARRERSSIPPGMWRVPRLERLAERRRLDPRVAEMSGDRESVRPRPDHHRRQPARTGPGPPGGAAPDRPPTGDATGGATRRNRDPAQLDQPRHARPRIQALAKRVHDAGARAQHAGRGRAVALRATATSRGADPRPSTCRTRPGWPSPGRDRRRRGAGTTATEGWPRRRPRARSSRMAGGSCRSRAKRRRRPP